MKFVSILCAALSTASAFSPSSKKVVASSSLTMASFEKEIGVQPPLGFWDPLGVLKGADQDKFDKLRSIELKHGRVAMLAVLGHIDTTAGHRCPGDIAFGIPFSSVPNGLAAFHTIPLWGIFQIVLFIGALEAGFGYQEKNIADECNARMTEWGWSDAKQRSKKAIELNNGRAAQMGILALMVHENINNNPYVLNGLFGAPVGFNQ